MVSKFNVLLLLTILFSSTFAQAATCFVACLAGQQCTSVAGAGVCASCALGTYNTAGGSTSSTVTACSPCQAGTIGNGVLGLGSTGCNACTAGTYASGTGNSVCTAASAGYAAIGNGATSQTICQVGTYSSNGILTGSSSCISCPVGQYQPSTGSTSCISADPGYYVPTTGASSELVCPAGSYSSNGVLLGSSGLLGYGSSSCTTCSAGYYSPSGSTACIAASPGYFVANAGAGSQTICSAGYYSSNGVLLGPSGLLGYASTSCTICPCGFYSGTGQSGCTPCNDLTNIASNILLGIYLSTPPGATSASQCAYCGGGSFLDIAVTVQTIFGSPAVCCATCAAGTATSTSANSASTTCAACTGNTYSLAGASQCSTCAVGTGPDTAHSTCTAVTSPGSRKRRTTCEFGYTVCPVGSLKSSGYECIDTKRNIQSCGGCWADGSGKDCSSIENADSVECVAGKCLFSCQKGFTKRGLRCVRNVLVKQDVNKNRRRAATKFF